MVGSLERRFRSNVIRPVFELPANHAAPKSSLPVPGCTAMRITPASEATSAGSEETSGSHARALEGERRRPPRRELGSSP